VIRLGGSAKSSKVFTTAQVDYEQMQSCLHSQCDLAEPDADHPLGLSTTFKSRAKDKAAIVQTNVIQKGKSMVRRMRIFFPEGIEP